MDRTIICTEPLRRDDQRTSCIEEARTRQARCRERYRTVIGSADEYEAYMSLLEATRAVLACELTAGRSDQPERAAA